MRRLLAVILVIVSVFALASCSRHYQVEGEKDALKVYTCSKRNMAGLEKIVMFEGRIVVVFDKKASDGSEYGIDFDKAALKQDLYTDVKITGITALEDSSRVELIDDIKFTVTMDLSYGGDNKMIAPGQGRNVEWIDVGDFRIAFDGNTIKLIRTETIADSYLIRTQEYSMTTKKWSAITQQMSRRT